ncbi:MAG: hypothetical protein PVG08_20740, partial [Desulfobacterales bacterium]
IPYQFSCGLIQDPVVEIASTFRLVEMIQKIWLGSKPVSRLKINKECRFAGSRKEAKPLI